MIPTSNGPDAPSDLSEPMRSSLTPRHEEALERFVLLWGEMASAWGINRTMAQIHALLYAMEEPLDTDAIMEQLQISRGNANMNLRSLVDWQLVYRTHLTGSRKDYYVAEKDVWRICTRVIQQRQQKEIGPVKETLQDCQTLLEEGKAEGGQTEAEAQFAARINNLVEFVSVFEGFTQVLLPFVKERNVKMIKSLIRFASRGRGGDE